MNRLMSALLSLAIACVVCVPLMAEGPNPQNPDSKIMQVYNYTSNYAMMTSVYDETTDKFTFLSNGMNRTGYYGDDGGFIETDRTVYHPNGQAAFTVSADGTYKEFSETGVMQKAWTTWVIEEDLNNDGTITDDEIQIKMSYADITYDANGRLETVSYKGWVDGYVEENGKHVQDNKITDDEIVVTRVEKYSADGKLLEITSYTYYLEKDLDKPGTDGSGTIEEDEKRWYTSLQDGAKDKRIEATEKYVYDAAGNLKQVNSFSDHIIEDGEPGHTGDNSCEMKQTGYITVENGKYQEQYQFATAGDPNTACKATEWKYSKNGAMISQKSFEPRNTQDAKDGKDQAVKLKSITYFDNHQRKSYSVNSYKDPDEDDDGEAIRKHDVIERWFYNDTSKTKTVKFNNGTQDDPDMYIFSIKAGGCMKHEKYAWYDNQSQAEIHRTYYHGGNVNTPAMMVKAGNLNAENVNNVGMAKAPNDIPASYDSTAQGTLHIQNNKVIFTVTDEQQYNEMIASLDSAIESASGTEREALVTIKNKISAQWKHSCKVTLVVGAIDEATGEWDNEEMKGMFDKAMHLGNTPKQPVTLNWGSWGVTDNGRVWIFI